MAGVWLFGERWHPLRRSTRQLLREQGLRGFFNLNFLHAYIYSRWSNQYIKFGIKYLRPLFSQRTRKRLSDRYHAKVLTHEQAEAIIKIDQEIPLRDLEQIIPYPHARNLILKGPPDVAAYECACRHARPNPCQPTQVCMPIGQPFVDFVLEHNPQSSRRLTQAEALELLRKEHERGHVHSAYFKDVMLDRFYVICNCCKCCCAGIEGMKKYGSQAIAPSGYVAMTDESLCTNCGVCVDSCPFDALSLREQNLVMDWEKCMGCGVCVDRCPNKARSLVRDERKGIPLDVRVLALESNPSNEEKARL